MPARREQHSKEVREGVLGWAGAEPARGLELGLGSIKSTMPRRWNLNDAAMMMYVCIGPKRKKRRLGCKKCLRKDRSPLRRLDAKEARPPRLWARTRRAALTRGGGGGVRKVRDIV